MKATVITDASWCPNTKAAGWAAWVKADGYPSRGFSGVVQQLCKSSNEAEIIAAAAGVGVAFRAYGATRILIQSDCDVVGREVWKHLPEDVRLNCAVRYKHVKGHTEIDDKRSWANRWCDEHAKIAMKHLRVLL
ncbi:hypothetical protein [Palleronia sp.]|uniref:hypothetical protein n=1 Tax=Palleronia sp. TaxID=1940284 RepID=UPI0035C7D6B6